MNQRLECCGQHLKLNVVPTHWHAIEILVASG